uniref:Pyruvate carboxyltransferase domain-containing protein n=1 Tax=Fusarium oxysporum (strain Fo5176) TaxID=660025 RepID=A0A0D2XB91_FUSOF
MCGTENGSVGAAPHPAQNANNPATSVYSQVQDFLSNTNRYNLLFVRESNSAMRSSQERTRSRLRPCSEPKSDFGVDYIELTSPVSSQASYDDCKHICSLGLKAKILTHVRLDDAKRAVECGVDGVDLVIGTSSFLREYSHGKSMEMIQKTAIEVIEYVKSQGVEVRFSSEDSFRSDLVDILALYKAVDKAGVNRVGIADTVGGATPRMVYDLVRTLRGKNAVTALEGGATHVDTSVLGIGERNGITPLGALMARMVVTAPEYTKTHYKLPKLKEIEEYVASVVQVNIPFNNPITGFCVRSSKSRFRPQ